MTLALMPPPVQHRTDPIDLIELITASFLARYKGHTLDTYTSDLRCYLRWCSGQGLNPLEAQRGHIELYLRWMERPDAIPATFDRPARSYSPSTVARRFGTIAGFYRFAVIDEHLAKDPTVHVRRPVVPSEKRGDWCNVSDVRRLMASAAAVTRWPSEYALMALLSNNILRIAEALAIDIEDIGEWAGYTLIHIMGKGSKPDTITCTPTTAYAVGLARGDRETGPLLLNRFGERMSAPAARELLDRHVRLCGITGKRITPHSFRRGGISNGLDAGIPLREMQILARHADPRTTSHYDRSGTNPAASATHPLGAMYAGAT